MGFETQEEAERWAEGMEFQADQAKEERMLKSAEAPEVPSSQKTLATIAELLKDNAVDPMNALNAAYTLGLFDGKLSMARVGAK